jgi:protein arginine N-methyltransferase 1
VYSLANFAKMIRDQVRMQAYTEALRQAVKPGSVVIDIGTGTGIFALIACQFGARKVYAIDPNPLIKLGEQMAAANGFADRIVFLREYSMRLELPEQADVIVGDLRGQLPFLYPNIAAYHDARTRFLKPDGVLIPQRDWLYAALLSAPDSYAELIEQPWAHNVYGLDMRAALPMTVNMSVGVLKLSGAQMILPGQRWEELVYGVRTEAGGGGVLTWHVETPGRAHFIALWFETALIDGVGFSGNPFAEPRPEVYGSSFLPLQEPLDLAPGQVVRLALNADPVGQGYIYRWKTSLYANPAEAQADQPIKQFVQSTFFGAPLSDLRKRVTSYKPRLKRAGEIQRFVLSQMQSGDQSLEAISRALRREFPGAYDTDADALAYVADLAEHFSE